MDDYLQLLEEHEEEAQQQTGLVNYTREFTIHDYTLRVTGKTKEQITESIKKMVEFCDGVELYAVGFEENHCHLVFEPWAKGRQFRDKVKALFDIKKSTNYSLSKIRDSPIKALAYILKDGDYNVGCHVSKNQLEVAQKICFGKGTKSFKKKHEVLLERLATDNNRKRYFKEYVTLKIEHNQRIYWHHIKAHCTQVFMRMDPHYRNNLIQRQWEDSGLMSKEEEEEFLGY